MILRINTTTEQGLEKVVNINNNNECIGKLEDEDTDYKLTLDLELQCNNEKFQKSSIKQNVRINVPDIDKAKIDLRSITAVVTDIRYEECH